VLGRRRGEAEEVQRVVADFMARFNCFGRRRPRRTGDGGTLAGGAWLGWCRRRRVGRATAGTGARARGAWPPRLIGQGVGSAVARTDAEGKAAAGATRVRHGHWGNWGSGPRWAFAGGLGAGPAVWDAGLRPEEPEGR
jgi:hypothetical protein